MSLRFCLLESARDFTGVVVAHLMTSIQSQLPLFPSGQNTSLELLSSGRVLAPHKRKKTTTFFFFERQKGPVDPHFMTVRPTHIPSRDDTRAHRLGDKMPDIDIDSLGVSQLRAYLKEAGADTSGCFEKVREKKERRAPLKG